MINVLSSRITPTINSTKFSPSPHFICQRNATAEQTNISCDYSFLKYHDVISIPKYLQKTLKNKKSAVQYSYATNNQTSHENNGLLPEAN